MNLLNKTINELKAIAKENEITVTGNKSFKGTWLNAITSHLENAADKVEDVEETLEELFTEADRIGNKYQTAEEIQNFLDELREIARDVCLDAADKAVEVVKIAYDTLTSEQAITQYKAALKLVVLAMILVYFYSKKLVEWVWSNETIRVLVATWIAWMSVMFVEIVYHIANVGKMVRSNLELWKNGVFGYVENGFNQFILESVLWVNGF